ncbi:MAG: hypothetical protein QW794_01725 [Thermosphaera sp.]
MWRETVVYKKCPSCGRREGYCRVVESVDVEFLAEVCVCPKCGVLLHTKSGFPPLGEVISEESDYHEAVKLARIIVNYVESWWRSGE